MIRQEPYIGMPINFDDYEAKENTVATAGPVEIIPQKTNSDMCCMDWPENLPIAMAYVPWQRWQEPLPLEKGFNEGTIFPDLNLPFKGYRGGMTR